MPKDDKFGGKRSLNREEWLAVLTQIALNKYVAATELLPAGDAVQRLVDVDLTPNLPWTCFHDADAFRSRFCYIEHTESVLRQYEPSLRMLYNAFAYGDGAIGDEVRSTKYMDIDELYAFVDRLDYVDECVTWREVKQAFVWSRLLVIDEQSAKGRAKLTQLSFEDFLEMVVRLAYMMALPSDAELAERDAIHAADFFVKLEEAEGPDAIEDFQATHSRGMSEPLLDDQPIGQKVTQFMEWLLVKVQGDMPVPTHPNDKLRKAAKKVMLTKAVLERFVNGK